MSFHKTIICGNLGADPELRYTSNGTAVCNLSVAVNEKWSDKQGQKQERTTWYKVTVWGAQAENCEKFLAKGRQVLVEGRIKTDSYEKDGVTHYTWELVANQVTFLSGGDAKPAGGNGQRRSSPPPAETAADWDDSDIPFVWAWPLLAFAHLFTQLF